jgi:pimeloyl-ACP methyl ester carboxylesterase
VKTESATQPVPDARPRTARRRVRRRVVVAATVLTLAALIIANALIVTRQSSDASGPGLMTVDGVAIHVREDGPRDAPTLVLIHGLGASTRWWDAVVPTLAARHHVVRLDLLGHGASAKPTGGGYSIPEQAARVGHVLDRLGITHAVVIGHSTGGYVATSLAEQRPDLVGALGLIDTGPRMDAFISDGPVGKLLFTPGVGQLLWRVRSDALIRKGLSTAFSRPGYQIPQQFVDDLRGMTYHSLTAASQASDDYLEQEDVPARLAPLGKPVLVIFGADDHRWRAAPSAAAYRALPGAQVDVLPGLGHSPMVEDPARTAALLLSYADSVPSRAGGVR